MAKIRGNQTLSGSWGQLWLDGELLAETSKAEFKFSANREDIQMGIDVDSKMTSLKGEMNITLKKVYSRASRLLEKYKSGNDVRCQIMTKLSDPDAVGAQQERWTFDNVWFNDFPLTAFEAGAKIEEELTGGFTPSDAKCLDEIKVM